MLDAIMTFAAIVLMLLGTGYTVCSAIEEERRRSEEVSEVKNPMGDGHRVRRRYRSGGDR